MTATNLQASRKKQSVIGAMLIGKRTCRRHSRPDNRWQLLDELNAVKEIIHKYNALSPADNACRLDILKGLLGHIGDDQIIINQPFYCDYGKQISIGKRFFANFHFTVLGEAKVTIRDDCFRLPCNWHVLPANSR